MSLLFTLLGLAKALDTLNIPSSGPPPSSRQYSVMSYSKALNHLVVFGGNQGVSVTYQDLWKFEIESSSWVKLDPNNSPPQARYSSGSFFKESTSEFCIFGGISLRGPLQDIWCFDETTLKVGFI